jgi:hypothetical protein
MQNRLASRDFCFWRCGVWWIGPDIYPEDRDSTFLSGMLITHLLNYTISYPTAEDFILWYCCNLFVCIEGVSEIK